MGVMNLAFREDGNLAKPVPKEVAAAEESYASYAQQVLGAAGWPWPEHLFLDRTKRPRFVHSVDELMHEMQYGSHMNEIVVFPNGLQELGQYGALRDDIRDAIGLEEGPPQNAAKMAQNAYEVLENLSQGGKLNDLKGKVQYYTLDADRKKVFAGGSSNACLAPKWEALKSNCPEEVKEGVYLAEMRRLESEDVPPGGLRKRRKSTLKTTMREKLHQLGMDVRRMLFWDDFSEGFFVGAGCSGYDLHVDIIPTSNVGSVFAGHKLLAVWDFPNASREVVKKHGREHFVRPLTSDQVRALEGACSVALAPPGSVYVFSGASAHCVCNVGFSAPGIGGSAPMPSLVVSSYEAFVGLHPSHVEALTETCAGRGAQDCEDDELDEFQEELEDGALHTYRWLQDAAAESPDLTEAALIADKALSRLKEGCRAVAQVLEEEDKSSSQPDSQDEEDAEKVSGTCVGQPQPKRQRSHS